MSDKVKITWIIALTVAVVAFYVCLGLTTSSPDGESAAEQACIHKGGVPILNGDAGAMTNCQGLK